MNFEKTTLIHVFFMPGKEKISIKCLRASLMKIGLLNLDRR